MAQALSWLDDAIGGGWGVVLTFAATVGVALFVSGGFSGPRRKAAKDLMDLYLACPESWQAERKALEKRLRPELVRLGVGDESAEKQDRRVTTARTLTGLAGLIVTVAVLSGIQYTVGLPGASPLLGAAVGGVLSGLAMITAERRAAPDLVAVYEKAREDLADTGGSVRPEDDEKD